MNKLKEANCNFNLPLLKTLFIWTGGDCHIYLNHLEQVEKRLAREHFPLPKLEIKRKPDSIFDYKFEDFEIVGYQSHKAIAAPIVI